MPGAPVAERDGQLGARPGAAPSRSSRTRKSLPRPWCLVRRMRGGQPTSRRPAVVHEDGCERRSRGVGVEPGDPGVAAEPGPLAAGEAPGAADGQVERLVQGRRSPAQVGEQLPVAEGLARRCATMPCGSAAQARGPRRGSRPPAARRSGASIRSASIVGGRSRAPTSVNGVGGWASRPGPKRENGPAAAEGHLEGPHDPAPVGRLHAAGGQRVELGEAARGARAVSAVGLELGPDLGVLARGCRGRRPPPAGRAPVPPTSSARRPRASMSASGGRGRAAGTRPTVNVLATGRARRSGGGGTSACSAGGRLGRADVHAPVHLHRVDRHELPRRSRRASARASADLPDAVAPTSAAWRPGHAGRSLAKHAESRRVR